MKDGAGFHWGTRVGALLLLCVGLLAGCGSATEQTSGGGAGSFDAQGAWQLVRLQVAAGQRPAGSPQLRRLAVQLVKLLPEGHFEPVPGEPGLRNVVGSLPGEAPAVVLGAHYDTLVKPKGFVGANNGAAGSAIVIEAARALQEADATGREVKFVLFDGEEPDAGLPEEGQDFYNEGLRGSRAYVGAHGGETGEMILLDYVGNRGLYLPREASSTESLWERLLQAATAVGAARFFSAETGPEVLDDHTPFLRAGIPAIDLIDWSYPGHSLADGLDKISRSSLDGVGESVVRLIAELRSE
ncbi:MAG TPA: M28 family metallopeptidase [Solirubrobacterales bacterium]|nr:M28 family metallopeptidase [Solirubrobacterales bacterium]